MSMNHWQRTTPLLRPPLFDLSGWPLKRGSIIKNNNIHCGIQKHHVNISTQKADKQKTTWQPVDSHKAHQYSMKHTDTIKDSFCAYFWWANWENMSRIFCCFSSTPGMPFFFPRARPDTRHFLVPTPENKIQLQLHTVNIIPTPESKIQLHSHTVNISSFWHLKARFNYSHILILWTILCVTPESKIQLQSHTVNISSFQHLKARM